MPKLLIVVVIVLGGALAMYRWPGAPLVFNSARGIGRVEPPAETTEKSPDKASERKVPRPKVAAAQPARTRSEATPPAPLAAQTAPAPIVSVRPDLPFPTPETLKKGSTASELRSRFGTPTIDIAGTSEGRVLEKYYYLNRERDRLTVITLENGLLISSNSLSSPYFQLPGVTDSGLPKPAR